MGMVFSLLNKVGAKRYMPIANWDPFLYEYAPAVPGTGWAIPGGPWGRGGGEFAIAGYGCVGWCFGERRR